MRCIIIKMRTKRGHGNGYIDMHRRNGTFAALEYSFAFAGHKGRHLASAGGRRHALQRLRLGQSARDEILWPVRRSVAATLPEMRDRKSGRLPILRRVRGAAKLR